MGIPIIGDIVKVVSGVLDKTIVDKDRKKELDHEIHMALLNSGLAQTEINKEEAKHSSIFVAGWRPFVGWVCGCALLWHFILYDFLNWAVIVFMPDAVSPPALAGTETLITVLLSMLGLGGLRSYEKLKGVSRDNIKSNK